ncbi:Sushi, von Willebrand factor type A, EGF and pentraxin domain-containing protein 1 [Holothuria leucospilota]|uniref:Sushi, von Willebrand factor type A, EGF and pentraxin domain-containing protein 1 n=1 Tax=Holothuria leucospilota TaxID=206669 RepID=A0A9Q1BTB8_HOLLE|nr:Sushi, von Willebrand factor type A, EGF and pentraxin domain-containing protein 1 [Holothuria leucospilota]
MIHFVFFFSSLQASPCAYPSLNDTRVEVSPNSTEHQHSEIVTFSCLSGYDLQGSANATCQFGEWDMGVEPTCKPSPCTKPSLNDTRVEVSPGITEYQHNETVAFSCISGYDLQGSANATCQFGKWDMGVEPTCEPLACDMPSVDDDMVEISPNKSEYQHNETVKFSCPNGYKLIGDETETCQFGVWDGRLEPSCHIEIKECANPYPEDYNVIIEPYEYRYENGSTVLYSCPEGFTLFGISSATCMFGRWVPSADPPSCEAKGCERPQVEGVNFEPARESYDDGDKIIFFCSDSGTLVGSDSSTCTRGEFSPSSFPTCADTTSEFCNSSSLENKDEISYTPEYETYNKGEEVYLSCKNSSLALVPFIGKMQCQGNNGWSPQFPDCGECRNSEMCQINSQRVCDKETRLCLCPPGFEPFEGICIETTAVVTEVYLDAHFNKTLEDNSSDEFLNLQKQVCFAFEITLTNRSSNVKGGYVSCYVESFSNGSIITDVVTKYNKEENVTPQQVTDIIATEAEQQEHYTIPYLTLNFTLDSEIKSNEKIINVDACGETDVCDPVNAECHYHGGSVYSCMCRTGFIDTFPDVPGVSCVPKVRDPPLALTVGLGVGVALCFVVILVTSVAIFGRYTNNDDSKTISSQDSNDDDDVNDLVPSHSPKVDLSMHNSFDTSFVNHRYNSDEYMSGSLDPVSETARMSAIAKIIQNMGNMKPMPRIQPPRGSNHNQIMSNL